MDESTSDAEQEAQADSAQGSEPLSEAAEAGAADAVDAGGEASSEVIGEANEEVIGGGSDAGVQAPQYEDLSAAGPAAAGGHPSLDIVLDVPVTVSLEVGKATMSVGELIKLGQGAVVELDRAIGEPLDVMVNGALVAHGEIVLVNEKFGIRLTSVVQPEGAEIREAS